MQPGLRLGWGRLYFVYGSNLLMNVPGSPVVLKSSGVRALGDLTHLPIWQEHFCANANNAIWQKHYCPSRVLELTRT